MTSPTLFVCAAALAFGSGVIAQKRATVGRFVDPDGRAIAHAVVTFATADPIGFEALAPVAVVTAETDDRGRFRAELEAGRTYSAWAVEPHSVARPARSRVVEGVVAGDVIELPFAERGPLAFVDVVGLAGTDNGPFELRFRCDARFGPEWSTAIDGDGRAALPPLPAGPRVFRVLDRDGRDLGFTGSWVGNRIQLDERHTLQVVVQDLAGRPVVGAKVFALLPDLVANGAEPFGGPRTLLRRIAAEPTDDDGRTRVTMTVLGAFLFAFGEGRVSRAGGHHGWSWARDGVLQPAGTRFDPEQPIVLKLRRRAQPRARVHREGAAVVGRKILALGEVVARGAGMNRSVSASIDFRDLAQSDELGVVAFAHVPAPLQWVTLVLKHDDGVSMVARARTSVPREPLDIDFARWPLVTLQALDVSAGAPADARIVLWSHTQARPLVLVADRAGRAQVRLEPGAWLVLASDGRSAGLQEAVIEVGDTQKITCRLAPMATCRVLVRDGNGQPVAGSRFHLSALQSNGLQGEDPIARWLADLADDINGGLTHGAVSDADGRITLRFLPFAGYRCFGWVDGSRDRIELVENGEFEVTLR